MESPGSLEAIAQGCVFLNPRRKGNRVRLSGKPTGRQVKMLTRVNMMANIKTQSKPKQIVMFSRTHVTFR